MSAAEKINSDEVEQKDGVEVEVERDEEASIKRPFDPEKIKIRTVNIVVDQLVSRINHDEIKLAPEFQRGRGIWDEERKSRLIESLLLRIPIPLFYVAADEDEVWSVVDGLQRSSTVYDYVTGEFKLRRLEYLTGLENGFFSGLPRPMQRRIRETQLIFNIIEPGTPEEVMFNIFRRINTGGMTLNGQEIRNAMYPGAVRNFLKRLAETKEFLDATSESIKPDRMADRECILRFLAFYITPWQEYSANDLDGYLGVTMRKINQMESHDREALEHTFLKSMCVAEGLFAFRKLYSTDRAERRKPISKALFEAWGVGLARRNDDEVGQLTRNRELVVSEFIDVMNNDWEFGESISYATGVPKRVRKRFGVIEQIIDRCLKC